MVPVVMLELAILTTYAVAKQQQLSNRQGEITTAAAWNTASLCKLTVKIDCNTKMNLSKKRKSTEVTVQAEDAENLIVEGRR